jgi:hypothetical protein
MLPEGHGSQVWGTSTKMVFLFPSEYSLSLSPFSRDFPLPTPPSFALQRAKVLETLAVWHPPVYKMSTWTVCHCTHNRWLCRFPGRAVKANSTLYITDMLQSAISSQIRVPHAGGNICSAGVKNQEGYGSGHPLGAADNVLLNCHS